MKIISLTQVFVDGLASTGEVSGRVVASWLNAIQEKVNATATEVVSVLTAAGIAVDASKTDQLFKAIQAIFRAMLAESVSTEVGAVQWFARRTPPPNYLRLNGQQGVSRQTIGSAASGATSRANADVYPLYEILWNDWGATVLAIQTSAGAPSVRGASALDDWNAGKRLPLPEARGEFFRVWDDGRGVDPGREFGSWAADQLKSHTHQSKPQLGDAITSGEQATISAGGGLIGLYGSFTTDPAGGAETAPRSLAISAFIRYK